jgi:DNA-binding transcriptional MerR regulator
LTTVTPDTEAQLTVEQLAHQSGMSVRNIRNHQSRGLLPPPEVRARKGYYGPRHLERLRVIQQMQAEGFKLSAIERLIGEHGTTADRFVGLRRLVTAPEEVESPEVVTATELTERFGEVDPKVVARAEKMGLLVNLGDGRYEATSPALIRAAEQVTARGVPLAEALTVIERVRRNSQSIARSFVKLFLDEVWQPFDDQGRPEERWEEITQSIEDLRPLASDAVVAMFRQVLADEMEDAFGKVLRSHSARRAGKDGD